jgi:hypothetical protein
MFDRHDHIVLRVIVVVYVCAYIEILVIMNYRQLIIITILIY